MKCKRAVTFLGLSDSPLQALKGVISSHIISSRFKGRIFKEEMLFNETGTISTFYYRMHSNFQMKN